MDDTQERLAQIERRLASIEKTMLEASSGINTIKDIQAAARVGRQLRNTVATLAVAAGAIWATFAAIYEHLRG